jgi:uncharacterized protein YceK
MKRLLPILMLIIATSGCGTITCLSVAQEDPKTQPIFGGVRTDINCIIGAKSDDRKDPYMANLVEVVAKPCSVIDLPLSLAADMLTLPYAIVWMIRHRPLPQNEANETGATGQNELLPARAE